MKLIISNVSGVPIYEQIKPVSYTHLDVYKRQLCDLAVYRGGKRPSGLLLGPLWNQSGAVSYTHLDVYKRQGYDAACYYDGKLLGRCTKADSDAYTLLMNCLLYTSRCV